MSPDTVQPLICSPRGDHWRKASAGKNFGLLESDAISVSSEATAFAPESHDPSNPKQSPLVRMAFRCSFCNRGFERKSYRDEHERNHRSNLNLMELCNEPDCGKGFSNKNLLRRHVKTVSLIIYVFRRQLIDFHRSILRRSNSYATIVEKPLRDKTMQSGKMALPYKCQ
jgi:hypothetical protein